MRTILLFTLGATCLFVRSAWCESDQIANDPTAHAWKVFIKLNTAVPNDASGRVEWETWALGREVFADPNTKPVWKGAGQTPATFQDFEPLRQDEMRRQQSHPPAGSLPGPEFDPTVGTHNETRLNKSVFDFIVDHDLYYAEGIEGFARNPANKFEFSPDSIEVKAQWRKIKPADAALYHTATRQVNGTQEIWGLTAMHITTKELPNWFWATFEHKRNPGREDVWPDVQPQARPAELKGSVWENYVLRGTQLDFVDSIGRPLKLASSQIEAAFQRTSSCITCHALAAVNPAHAAGSGVNLDVLPIFDSVGQGFVGTPNTSEFLDPAHPATAKFRQMDFVWSFPALSAVRRKFPLINLLPT